MTIGRVAITEDPYTITRTGNYVQLTTEIVATNLDELKARVQQLQGMENNPDEKTFPMTWSEDPTFDGFYKVVNVRVNSTTMMLSNYIAPIEVSLERVSGGFGKPRFETLTSVVVRTNAHGVATPTTVSGAYYTGGTDPIAYPANLTATAALTRTSEDGSILVYQTAAPLAATSWWYSIYPADFYKASAKVEVKYGSTWYPVVGQQIPAATAENWRISNGLVRIYPTAVSGNGRFTMEVNRGAGTWTGMEVGIGHSAFTFQNISGAGVAGHTPTILRNSPELVAIQLLFNTSSTMTLAIRRGCIWIENTINDGTGVTRQWGWGCSAVTAMTAFTGGARATANDGNGNRPMFACPVAITNDLVNGRTYLTAAAATAQFMITPDYQLTNATDTLVRDEFLGAAAIRQQVVVR